MGFKYITTKYKVVQIYPHDLYSFENYKNFSINEMYDTYNYFIRITHRTIDNTHKAKGIS